MSLLIVEFDPPPEVAAQAKKARERVDRFRRGSLKPLSKDQVLRFEKWLKKHVSAALKEFGPLQRRLTRWYNLLEGVVEDTNWPFEGASNVTVRTALVFGRVFRSLFNKTAYADEDLFAPVLSPDAPREGRPEAAALERLGEHRGERFARETNGLQELRGGTLAAYRDGTFLLEGSVERRLERYRDERTYRQIEKFQADYPDAAAAGVAPARYQEALDHFLVEGEEAELLVRFAYDAVCFEGVEYRAIPRARFLVYPTTVRRLRDALLYGGGRELTAAEVQRRGRRGEFYKDGVARALARRGRGAELVEWDRARLFAEGRAAPDPDQAPLRVLDLVATYDLDADGTPELWRVSVARDGEEVVLLACRPYDVPRNVRNVIPFRLASGDGFDGHSYVGDAEDLHKQLDDLFRHDFNVMVLTSSPIFLAKNTLKDDLDLGRAENVVRPGVTYWLDDPSDKSIRQLPVQDVAAATGDNQPRIAFLMRLIETIVGVTLGESGQQTPDDPRAPARKTHLLLLQANRRVDDSLDEWALSYPDLADLDLALEQQLGRNPLVPPELLPYLRWAAKRRSITLTPEYALARIQSLFASYSQMRQGLLTNDPVVRELWERLVRASGEPEADKFLLDPQQAMQQMMLAQQMAMQQQAMASKLNARKKGEETLAKESAKKVVDHVDERMQLALTGQLPDAVGAPPGAPPGAPTPAGVR